ncbi:MAG TPA: ankyrin repeat domain-containing protein [Vicinamibacterales bacterium]|nr:ankyrin repeat domain-containing protein [Vicinamibacterales bacterium]
MRGRPHILAALAVAGLALQARPVAAPDGLTDAARRGDKAAVRRLLKEGADVNAAPADGMSALHWAALQGDVDLAKMLIFAGAGVSASTRLGGYTPLLMAATNGDAAMIDALVSAGADPKAANGNGTTALMLAAASGHADAVTLLLDRGADVNARDRAKQESALMFAAAAGNADVVRVLAARGADLAATTSVIDLKPFTAEQEAIGGGPAPRPAAGAAGALPPPPPRPSRSGQRGGVDRRFTYNELVGTQGGLTALLLASRQGERAAVDALLAAGADINQGSAGDGTTPLLIATINGRFDLARYLLDRGASPAKASANGVTPLYAVVNCQWAQKALFPQPRAFEQQHVTYLELMTAFLDKGADPDARVNRKVWYSGYNSDFSAIDEEGATPFWRAAYAADVDAMKLLVARGADPRIPTSRVPGRARAGGGLSNDVHDVSGLAPVPVGGPGMTALHAASGPGYGEGFAGNAHRFAPGGMLPAVKYLVEVLHADVNATDQDGNTPLHNAASRGDNEMIRYLVSKGADVRAVNREGQTTVDMANGPVQRVQPFPDTIALLEKLGAKNNHRCVSC